MVQEEAGQGENLMILEDEIKGPCPLDSVASQMLLLFMTSIFFLLLLLF